jgi:hypothetical protein
VKPTADGGWALDGAKTKQTLISCDCAGCSAWLRKLGRPNRNADGSETYECTASSCTDYGGTVFVEMSKTACEGIAPISGPTLRGATGPANGSLGKYGFCQPQCRDPTPAPFTDSPLPAPCVRESTKLEFSADKLTTNNLGGMGPGSGAEEMRFASIGNVWQESAQGTDLAPGEWDGSGDTSFSQCKAKAESSVHSVHAFAVASLARSEQCTLGMRIMHSCRV